MSTYIEQVAGGDYDNHVLPFLWMRGEDHATIREYLEQITASDIHEVCLESRPHPDFCGEGWWRDLAFVIGECKRLGLKIWILDDSHFPTGYANGALAGDDVDPALKKTVLRQRVIDVVGPTPGMSVSLGNPFDATERFYGAVLMRDGEAVDVPLQVLEDGGSLHFDAPEGLCQLHLYFTSTTTGFRDEYINMVDAASCRALIDAVYEPHYARFAEEFGQTILGFFTDEPGFMNEKGTTADGGTVTDSLIGKSSMSLPWSVELERRLHAALGDAEKPVGEDAPYLRALAQLWGREDAGAAVRQVYMDVATALYRECFDGQLGDWCRAHGVMHIGHVIEDKGGHTRLGVGAGHYFRAIAGQDMAGVDIVINQLVPGMDAGLHSYGRGVWDMEFFNYALPKLGSSAAHIDPRKQGRCMAEVFGAFGWHEGLKEMKWICDHFMVRGVNWFVPHAFSMAGFPDRDCPPHFFAHGNNPQFRHFGKLMSYVNRVSSLLSGGRALTSAAVVYHADAEWAGEAMPVQKVARELSRAQIDFDFVPEEAFFDAERYAIELVEGGRRGFTVNGQAYRCLVLPYAEYRRAQTVAGVRALAEAGVPVFVVDGMPGAVTDGIDVRDVEDGCAGDASASARVVPLAALAGELQVQGLYEVRTSEAQPWLRAYRYDRAGERYLFLVNEHPKLALSTTVSGANGSQLIGVAYDLLNGGAAKVFTGALELAPYESVLVALDAEPGEGAEDAGTERGVDAAAGDALTLDGPWSLSFSAPLAYPVFGEQRVCADLMVAREEAAFFDRCGTFRYETAFTVARSAATAALDLGEAYEMVDVWLDGGHVDSRIAPPHTLGLGDLAAGEHTLAIEVTNTLDKDIRDMFSLTEPAEPSGLMGPVTLILA